MTLAPQSMLWKWFLQRFTSDGGTVMRQPFFNCRYVITNREREGKNDFLFSSTIVPV